MGWSANSPVHSVWKDDLYRMQLEAPIPIPIVCNDVPPPRSPPFLGRDYHGLVSHTRAIQLLESEPNGAYLVRNSKISNGEFYTLSLKFNDKIHHYKLYYDDKSGFYVREKRYDCVRSLVADGLITMYLELKVPNMLQRLSTANYQESPYMTLNKRKLRALSRQNAKNAQLTNNNGMSATTSDIPALSDLKINAAAPERTEKRHPFKTTTFKGLNWCELCGNFLWGFTHQGVKCNDCGMMVHSKCSEKIPDDCVPDLKHIRGVFGIDLTTLLTAHNAHLPFVVTKCIGEVESRGLTTEGIYRLSGFADEIELIKMTFDRDGEKADLNHDKYPNVNVITGALKLYLRLLPIPLITFIVHPKLIQAIQLNNEEERYDTLRAGLRSLPKPHYDTLKYTIEHLFRVSQHSAINKMTAYNLATVFAPTIIGPSVDSIDSMILPDMTSDILLIEQLITNSDAIFGN